MTAATKRSSAVFPSFEDHEARQLRPRRPSRVPVGSLVGRDRDVARVLEVLSYGSSVGGSRLVTILGPPGMGKTRLAERCLELVADDLASDGGAWFCDLTSVTDAGGLPHAVTSVLRGARASGLSDEGSDLVEHFVAAGPTLLVLDNFEQLVAAADVVHGWCQAAPELSVILTSRERLGVDGEVVVELGPLDCPPETAEEATALESDAVRLLVTRARAAGADVGDDARILGAIVRHLDGIPLAIELAAARMRVLRPAELLARLSQRLPLLARRPQHAQDRHATLESAIAWSWQLLAPEEQRALAACSIFAGGFTVEAGEAVLGVNALDLLGALRDKSLVHVPGEGRLALYASIAEFAASRLSEYGPDVVADARARHAAFFAGAARALLDSRRRLGNFDATLRTRLRRDRANVVAALAFLRNDGAAPESIANHAQARRWREGVPIEAWIDALGAALGTLDASEGTNEALVAEILLARQSLFGLAGRFAESQADRDRLLAMDLPRTMRAQAFLAQGIQLRYQGRVHDALASHLEGEKTIDDDTPVRLLAMHHACRGRLAHELGDLDEAREHNDRARAVAARVEQAPLEAVIPLANVALIEQELGRFDEAVRLLDGALAAFERNDEQVYLAIYLLALGDVLLEQGKPEEARRSYERAARFFAGWSSQRQAVELYGALAALEARYGLLDDAEVHLERARRSVSPGARVLEVLVEIASAQVDLRRARDGGRTGDVSAIGVKHAALTRSDVAATSFVVRFALRLLGQALGAGAVPAPTSERAAIVIARDGSAFVRAGKRVDLGRRGSLRRILAALVAAERGASRDALLAEGWPGERLLAEAASKRLRVAIATLRSLGLREAIVTRDDGYALDPRAVQGVADEV